MKLILFYDISKRKESREEIRWPEEKKEVKDGIVAHSHANIKLIPSGLSRKNIILEKLLDDHLLVFYSLVFFYSF